MAARVSELILIGLLIVLIGFTRIYWGNGFPIMFVWKGAFAYADTFINLSEILSMPTEQLAKTHPEVLWQLEEMGIVENSSDRINVKPILRLPQNQKQLPK